MAINKVIDRNNNVLIDLTNDTVSPSKVLAGTKFHGPDGKEYTGQVQPNELDSLKYTFIDYDGTIMYSFTDDEIDAMTELPAGPDHTDENLTFQEWNWTLDELKSVDRTRLDRPIVGANLITTDGKTYITIRTIAKNVTQDFYFTCENSSRKVTIDIDWGDGSSETKTVSYDTKTSHTFSEIGEYTIVVGVAADSANKQEFRLGPTSDKTMTDGYGKFVESIKIGEVYAFGPGLGGKLNYSAVKKLNIPRTVTLTSYKPFYEAYGIDCIVFPRNFKTNNYTLAGWCTSLKIASIPPTFTSLPTSAFQYCYSLKHIYIPDTVQTFEGSYHFSNCAFSRLVVPEGVTTLPSSFCNYCTSLKEIILPSTLTKIGDSVFSGCYSLDSIAIPEGVTSIAGSAFSSTYSLFEFVMPSTLTSIGNSCFNSCKVLILDLSQTPFIALTGNIGLNNGLTHRVKVPQALLSQYKSASYWSNYASIIEGV